MTIDVEVEERKSHLDFPEGDLDGGDMGSNTKIRRPVGMKRRGNETKNITSRKIFDKFNNFEHEWENANSVTIDPGGMLWNNQTNYLK